jgi:hypothetical protein
MNTALSLMNQLKKQSKMNVIEGLNLDFIKPRNTPQRKLSAKVSHPSSNCTEFARKNLKPKKKAVRRAMSFAAHPIIS